MFQIPLAFLVIFAIGTEAQQRRIKSRLRPVQPVESEETSEEAERPVQYYRPQPKQDNAQELVYVNEEEYQNLYGNQGARAAPRDYRPAVTTVRPLSRAQSVSPRSKEPETKAPPVQTIRNYNKVNDDGSFTFGYEAADGSFKEETRGTDCVVRGRYGYVDPEGESRTIQSWSFSLLLNLNFNQKFQIRSKAEQNLLTLFLEKNHTRTFSPPADFS